MFRIRKIYDDLLPINKEEISQVQEILRTQFNDLPESDIVNLADQLRDPVKYKFRSVLLVADDNKDRVLGFALIRFDPKLNFCYLDFISAKPNVTGRGIGGALYERVREVAKHFEAKGIYFECLPDDEKLCPDKEIRKQNIARLKFYERFGAFPIINTLYETPVNEDSDCPPYITYDNLGSDKLPSAKEVQNNIRAILERKYSSLCTKEYINMVIDSIKDDPIKLRTPKYIKSTVNSEPHPSISDDLKIALIINDKHDIHHMHERGYVESPVRIKSIQKRIEATLYFKTIQPKKYPLKHITAVHDDKYVKYLERVCKNVPEKKSIYPYVFPIRNSSRPPYDLPTRAGYYCIDTFTPLNQNAYLAARRAVDCALTAADEIIHGAYIGYALVRPPGHHAEKKTFGGFCYLNSNAIAANYLSQFGKIAILDVDYHHGNGQQTIFYDRSDVLTISIHGHPRFAYPYFSGFEEEIGVGEGKGYNVNYPLSEKLDGQAYRTTLRKAIHKIKDFKPRFLVVALGLDTAKGDPTGTWSLTAKDFEENGIYIGNLKIPTLVIQEGGYKAKSLGVNAKNFFTGLWNGYHQDIKIVEEK